MLKVLIADDEPDICELINKLIEWENLNLINIGFAYNGMEALEQILRQKPDIVISDIQMPGFTGLQIIEKVKDELPDIKFVVISGYQDFEYAQQAIRFGVKEYILKPISKKELNLTLQRIVQEKGLSDKKEQEDMNLREDLQRKNLILRKNELSQCATDFQRMLNEENFSFQEGVFLGVCVHTSLREKKDILAFQATEALENIGTRICDAFREQSYDIEYCVNDCNAYIVMNYSDLNPMDYFRRKDWLQRYLNEANIHYPNLKISIGIGQPVYSAQDLRLIETSEHANTLRVISDISKVIEYRQEMMRLTGSDVCQFDIGFRQKLLHYIEIYHIDEAKQLVLEKFKFFKEADSINISRIYPETINLIRFLKNSIVDLGLRPEISPEIDGVKNIIGFEEMHKILANTDTLDEIRDFVILYVQTEILYCHAYQKNKIGEPIRLAQEFVKKNIHRQISLEEAAEHAFVSPTYFSTLFKKQTGSTFSDYVIEQRIDEAKRLLKDPSLNISEVAFRVGYADSRHFSKLFQKIVGLKPTAYRKIYL